MTLKAFKKISLVWIILFSVFNVVNIASAGVAPVSGADCGSWGIRCTGSDTSADIIAYLWVGINVALSFLAIIAAGALVYYGILYIISRGEEEKARQAKTGIVYALLGMLVVGLAAWIVNAIINM